MTSRLLLYFLIAVTSTFHLQAQSYGFIHYDTKDGLPSATVYDITQDEDGFVWFATENGLSRFDGKNFRTYTTKDGLPDNSVLKVHSDLHGKVYFVPFTRGLFYFQHDSIFKADIPEKYKSDLTEFQHFISKKGAMIITGRDEIYLMADDTIKSFADLYRYNSKQIKALAILDTLLVLRTVDSIFYLPNSGKNSSFAAEAFDPRQVFDEQGNQHLLDFPLIPDFSIREYLPGGLAYFYTNRAVYLFNRSTGKLLHQFNVEMCSNAFIDKENNFWIATLGNGIYRFPSFDFRHLNFDGKSEIFSLARFENQLLAGSAASKLYRIPLDGKLDTFFTSDFSAFNARSRNTSTRTFGRNRVYTFYVENKDIYIGMDGYTIKQTPTRQLLSLDIIPIKDIDIVGDNMLICTGRAAFTANKESLTLEDTLVPQRTTCGAIYQGNYYVGTLGGLVKIDSGTKKITELYTLFPPLKQRITAIEHGRDDDLWIATSGSGLVHYKGNKIIRTFTSEDGLTSDICTTVFVDDTLVWLGTNNGLNRIEITKEKPRITRFNSATGLAADFINAIFVSDSQVYVGTARGVTFFNKNNQLGKSMCVLHILDVSENSKKLKFDSSYTFPHDALNIQVDFTAISFKSAGDITYYYQLKGLNNNWTPTKANFVNFPTLQPNNYTLLLKAVNKFGIESNIIAIKFSIKPPWWQTWFFRIAALVAIALLVLFIYRYNIRRIKQKEKTKRDIESRFAALEQRALQAQMNPHFIFNCLNSIQTFILNFDAVGANMYLTTFASLIRQTLDNSMQPLIPVASEIKYLETYLGLEKLRFREKFRYEIDMDETIDQNNTLLPGMLLQPYVENSLRHGIQHRKDNLGLITISIHKLADNVVLYTVTDNGVGRKMAAQLRSSRHIEYQSRGISINEKRVAAINNQFNTSIRIRTEDVLDENGNVSGTEVSVLVPPFINHHA